MRSDGNTLDWKITTSSLTFLIEVVKSLLSALAITVYFCTKTQREFTYKNMQFSNSNFPIAYALIYQRNDIKIFKMHMQSFAS